MTTPAALLDPAIEALRSLLRHGDLLDLADHGRAELLRRMGEIMRLCEAVTVEAVAAADPEFSRRVGCRSLNEFLQRALLADAAAATSIVRAADAVRVDRNLVSGELLPARWPALRAALLDGAVGVSGVLAATRPFERAHDRIGASDRLRADASLAAFARGDAAADGCGVRPDGSDDVDRSHGATWSIGEEPLLTEVGPPATPGDLRQVATYLTMMLDPDGAEPDDLRAQRTRFLSIGRLHRGTHCLTANLLPEVAAQLQLIIDAFGNPRVGGAPAPGVRFVDTDDDAGATVADERAGTDGSAVADRSALVDEGFAGLRHGISDSRTAGQKRHDALAAALSIAARHDEMPQLGGAAPTLVVQVDARDVVAGTGWATLPHAESPEPVPVSVAHQVACAGAVQRVAVDDGRIVGISVVDRVFTAHQRRAIVLRDGECLIPGCHVSAAWCEIHHVTEHARGGPTHTDNGVPLCWWHHRSLGSSGWEIRMNRGRPQIRGPHWWDPSRRWRAPTPLLRVPHRRSAA